MGYAGFGFFIGQSKVQHLLAENAATGQQRNPNAGLRIGGGGVVAEQQNPKPAKTAAALAQTPSPPANSPANPQPARRRTNKRPTTPAFLSAAVEPINRGGIEKKSQLNKQPRKQKKAKSA